MVYKRMRVPHFIIEPRQRDLCYWGFSFHIPILSYKFSKRITLSARLPMPRISSESQQAGEGSIIFQGSVFGILLQLLTGCKQARDPCL